MIALSAPALKLMLKIELDLGFGFWDFSSRNERDFDDV